ncbi:unnamed protein product [Orchesella dallaii]|uniref:Uncharacterized protein n=1 Tax=Orchesella dallaii TaxID=48710 RepID=A0ABP1R0U8_9HEXA
MQYYLNKCVIFNKSPTVPCKKIKSGTADEIKSFTNPEDQILVCSFLLRLEKELLMHCVQRQFIIPALKKEVTICSNAFGLVYYEDVFKIIRGLRYVQPWWEQLDHKSLTHKLYTILPPLKNITGRKRKLTSPLSHQSPDQQILLNSEAEIVTYSQKLLLACELDGLFTHYRESYRINPCEYIDLVSGFDSDFEFKECNTHSHNEETNKLKRKRETVSAPSQREQIPSLLNDPTSPNNEQPFSGILTSIPEVPVPSIYILPSFFQNLAAKDTPDDKPLEISDLYTDINDIMK